MAQHSLGKLQIRIIMLARSRTKDIATTKSADIDQEINIELGCIKANYTENCGSQLQSVSLNARDQTILLK